jgi:hypothetical protein
MLSSYISWTTPKRRPGWLESTSPFLVLAGAAVLLSTRIWVERSEP